MILVPTDFSALSDNALRYACDIAREHGSSVRLFHVVEVIQQCMGDYCLDGAMVADIQAKVIESAEALIDGQIKRVVKPGDVAVLTAVKQGIPFVEILIEQEDRGIDLVVMASLGKTGILSHFGSVTDKVMRGAKCPVLVVKGGQ
jgi:universal stress protein A